MKTLRRITFFKHGEIYHVHSEPGDATAYDYIVYFDEHHIFSFMPTYKNSFSYPQRIDYYEIQDMAKEELEGSPNEKIVIMARDFNCNPFTLMECIRTMKEIKK